MSSIAGLATSTFVVMRGPVQLAGYRLKELVTPGVYGKAWQLTGFHGRPFTMTTDAGFLVSGLGAAKIAHGALQGQVVTVTDDYGVAWTNVVVIGVEFIAEIPLGTPVGDLSGKEVLLRTRWVLDIAATYY